MANQMWFGIPGVHLQWVPCPLIDSTVTRKRYVERMQFESGGGDARRSSQYQMEYNFTFSGLAHEVEGIDAFNKFAQGFYGDDLIYLAHPAAFETNLFSAAWASPGIIEQGWKSIYPGTMIMAMTGSSTRQQPRRTATWNIGTDAGVAANKFTIVIPPTHTLYLGASGLVTGTGVVQVRPYGVDYTPGATQNLTMLSQSGSVRMNTTFDGATYSSVDVYLTRTDATASTVTLTSMMAQLYKTTATPALPTDHYQGEGSTGLMFVDDAIVETYSYMFPPRKGISTVLTEVGAWR
jgi:hypothetical protein